VLVWLDDAAADADAAVAVCPDDDAVADEPAVAV